jgi:hypothetical protein
MLPDLSLFGAPRDRIASNSNTANRMIDTGHPSLLVNELEETSAPEPARLSRILQAPDFY